MFLRILKSYNIKYRKNRAATILGLALNLILILAQQTLKTLDTAVILMILKTLVTLDTLVTKEVLEK